MDKKLRTQSIDLSVENYLKYEEERMESEIIKFRTFNNKRYTLNNHLIPYLLDIGITKTRQINDDTFSRYLIYRKGVTKLTLQMEISQIKDFLSNWLVKKRLIEPEVVSNKKLFPEVKIKMNDLMSNPPISGKDWMVINQEIRRWVKESIDMSNHRVNLWRNLFWNFTMISKNSGCRPEELMKLKWRDVDVVDVGRISESKRQGEIEDMKSEGIDVISNENYDDGGWVEGKESIGREQRLISYITVTSGKTGQIREVPTNTGYVFVRWRDFLNSYYDKHFTNEEVQGNDLVFGNVNNEGKPYYYTMFTKSWRTIRELVQDRLEGNKFSDEPYTIYSMRSTFIENKLVDGLDLFLLSRISGHDPKVLLKYYERMDIRKRSEEITAIHYGKRKKDYKTIQLFNE